jgi:hypothetical protein
MPSEKKPQERSAESEMINIVEKPAWLCRVVEAVESKTRNSHELKVEILNDDGTPFVKPDGQPMTMPKWVPKKEGYFKEAFLRVFLPRVAENGGDWDYDDLLGKYAIANMVEEESEWKGKMRKRINIGIFDAVPEAQQALLNQTHGSPQAAAAPSPKPTPPKPVAAKSAASTSQVAAGTKPPMKPVPVGAKPSAPAGAKPAGVKPVAPAKPASSTTVNEDSPFGDE